LGEAARWLTGIDVTGIVLAVAQGDRSVVLILVNGSKTRTFDKIAKIAVRRAATGPD
jgi:hypothetical protein